MALLLSLNLTDRANYASGDGGGWIIRGAKRWPTRENFNCVFCSSTFLSSSRSRSIVRFKLYAYVHAIRLRDHFITNFESQRFDTTLNQYCLLFIDRQTVLFVDKRIRNAVGKIVGIFGTATTLPSLFFHFSSFLSFSFIYDDTYSI